MKELILYLLVAISTTILMGFSVHMVLGGMVEESTEHVAMATVMALTISVIAFMFWDVIKRRKAA
ncbi:MAG: hypothetical protein ACC707_08905 [Thiohalomonadales bacterium]